MRNSGKPRCLFSIEPDVLRKFRGGCYVDGHPMEQAEAAALVGVSRNTWSMWETGRRGMRRDYLRKFIEATAGSRIGEPVYTEQPQELYVSDVRFVPRATPVPVDPMGREADGPTAAPDIIVPDCSELEAPELMQDR